MREEEQRGKEGAQEKTRVEAGPRGERGALGFAIGRVVARGIDCAGEGVQEGVQEEEELRRS